ncbi:MAG: ribosome biogenesis GTPase Der [Bacillota bacterium]
MRPRVVIVGRPNVGKSTLFNRIAARRIAIAHRQPGVTRDPIEADVEWCQKKFSLVDTGGISTEVEEEIQQKVVEYARRAMEKATVIVLVTDGRVGLTPEDREIADAVRQTGKPVVLAVNKLDEQQWEQLAAEFWELGLGEPVGISAEHGLGIGDLLDRIAQYLPTGDVEEPHVVRCKVALVGRPNAGKSSLLNRIIEEERSIVSEIPGTTRDSIDVAWDSQYGNYLFIDTPGLRRKTRIQEELEQMSAGRALLAVGRADVCVLVVDSTLGVTEQDCHIAGRIVDQGKAAVVALNKWDLVRPEEKDVILSRTSWRLHFMDYAEVLQVSALTGQGVQALIKAIRRAWECFGKKVPEGDLNYVLHDAVTMMPLPGSRGRSNRLYRGIQLSTCPPAFAVEVSDPEAVPDSYLRYLQGRLREAFELRSTPIRIVFRKKGFVRR